MRANAFLTGAILGSVIGVYFAAHITPYLWLVLIAGVYMFVKLLELK